MKYTGCPTKDEAVNPIPAGGGGQFDTPVVFFT